MMLWNRWRPDATGPNVGFAMIADNVLPKSAGIGQYGNMLIGYAPFQGLVVPGCAGALSGAPRGQ